MWFLIDGRYVKYKSHAYIMFQYFLVIVGRSQSTTLLQFYIKCTLLNMNKMVSIDWCDMLLKINCHRSLFEQPGDNVRQRDTSRRFRARHHTHTVRFASRSIWSTKCNSIESLSPLHIGGRGRAACFPAECSYSMASTTTTMMKL